MMYIWGLGGCDEPGVAVDDSMIARAKRVGAMEVVVGCQEPQIAQLAASYLSEQTQEDLRSQLRYEIKLHKRYIANQQVRWRKKKV